MSRRLPTGGSRIDRSRPVTITVDGVEVAAYHGDTVASALLAADRPLLSRGIYSGRPRGVMGVGVEDACAYVQVLSGGGEPMVAATTLEVHDGLAVERIAGRGRLPAGDDTTRYDTLYGHAEIAVVGGGLAGLRAAVAAAEDADGARVLILDDGPALGGAAADLPADSAAGRELRDLLTRLDGLEGVTVLTRTTVTGSHGHGRLVALEQRPHGVAKRRLHHVQAVGVVLATGSHERPLVFADNDRPGVMLACAAADYVTRYAVLPGERAVVWTAHDAGLHAAVELADAGTEIVAVLDVRETMAGPLAAALAGRGIALHLGAEVTGTDGSDDESGRLIRVHTTVGSFDVDLLAISGGANPAVELFSHPGGRTRWSDEVAGFVPDVPAPGQVGREVVVGAAAGDQDVVPGWRETLQPPATVFRADAGDPELVFLDPHRDATLADLRRAHAAGLSSVEHVKRFTTIGTGADQGRGFGVLAVGVLAQELGRPIEEVGTTTYRPPYVPLSFALLAGRNRGELSDPVRVSQAHDRVAHAPMEDVGQWKRPWYFPRSTADGLEDLDASVAREVRAVRTGVGMMDASTLGKILLQGADVGVLLDRVYTNLFSTLKVGKVRYGVMCGPDGMVVDDGTTARLSGTDWLMTTTTGNAAAVLDTLEEWHQTEWPGLDIALTSVTDQWAVVAVAGPRSRDVVATLAPQHDWSAEAFGFMDWREAPVAGIPARVLRISFSGELAFELHVPSWYAAALWDAVEEAGAPHGITPYGTETMHVLRAEKGFPIVGQDTDGTVTPHDLGMSWAVSRKKTDFIGMRSLARADARRPDRRQLVGLVPLDGSSRIVEGAQLVAHGADLTAFPVAMAGHVTSAYPSGHDGRPFALALLDGGRDRVGEVLDAVDDLVPLAVRVTGPVSYDEQGARRDG
ncbi:sarcosine oxidase subunit alpha [Nocardioides psychrotolerans]|uniref:Sarcosine oxidase subunit alpha n=1 Tax=Nocardioides psychrotolerans TaxID=1005945 RepID=A0A1I3ETU4_9ACTN|nr:2Fe-2S iron-sulfur cluster-binding protein [Nocardioides psychrotolerans]GEP39141.1 sarcosine oxidase subunit alpha [Nocardioides psychrotolerans]SFI02389.1 sarcosine oxidase subunit alpha [Nocardioides psychrotolerans]